jgi:uncharacterized membrane protein
MSESNYSRMFLALLIVGFLTFFVGMVFLAVASSFLGHGNSTGFGVIIFLGPIPIVIGSGPEPVFVLLIAALVAVLVGMVFLLVRERREKTGH